MPKKMYKVGKVYRIMIDKTIYTSTGKFRLRKGHLLTLGKDGMLTANATGGRVSIDFLNDLAKRKHVKVIVPVAKPKFRKNKAVAVTSTWRADLEKLDFDRKMNEEKQKFIGFMIFGVIVFIILLLFYWGGRQ